MAALEIAYTGTTTLYRHSLPCYPCFTYIPNNEYSIHEQMMLVNLIDGI